MHSYFLCYFSENDLLKHQLKKYVAAVQSLRRNEPSDIGRLMYEFAAKDFVALSLKEDWRELTT